VSNLLGIRTDAYVVFINDSLFLEVQKPVSDVVATRSFLDILDILPKWVAH
jgi:hypothetical protein